MDLYLAQTSPQHKPGFVYLPAIYLCCTTLRYVDLRETRVHIAAMNFDISHLLAQWDYQPGQVVVRKFMGNDGVEKVQLRVDMGLLQMNATGRPDGKRPLG